MRRPWLVRLHDAHPVAPWRAGVGLFAALSLAFLALEVGLGGGSLLARVEQPQERRDVVLAGLNFLLLAYAVAARLHFARASRRSLEVLRPALASSPEVDALLAETGSLRAPALWAALGLVIASLPPLLVDPGDPVYDPRTWSREVAWHRTIAPFVGASMVLPLAGVIAESRRFDRLAAALRPLDVFDLRPLEPFVRQGLTQALLLAGSLAVGLLFLVEDRLGPVVALIGCVGALGAGLGLVLPLRGARARLRAARDAALARCREALAAAAPSFEAPASEPAPAAGRFADLAALERRLVELREWPFDASTLLRFALYLSLPLGSWAGGALVERAIDALLDR
jgi:hypothetical protein